MNRFVKLMSVEVIARSLGARASCPQVLEKCGRGAHVHGKAGSFAITSAVLFIVVASVLIGCGGNNQSQPPWLQTYTVTFDSRGGSSVLSQSVLRGNQASEPIEPTRAEHNFDGWYSEPERINRVIFPYSVTRNVTLYAKWNWTEGIQIYTSEDLNEAFSNGNGLEGNYRLERDISFENYVWAPPGSEEEPFSGIFDGNGYKITGLRIGTDVDPESLEDNDEFVGFFRYIVGGEIRNLMLENVEVSGGHNAGAIVGYMEDGKISNSSSTGIISTAFFESSYPRYNFAGGIAGYVFNSEIIDCYSAANIADSESFSTLISVGGIAGGIGDSEIIDSYSTGNITVSAESSALAGGMAGWIFSSTVTNSYSTGDVNAFSESGSSYAGGIAGGVEDSTIADCYSTGDVNASAESNAYAGGIAGWVEDSEIIDCYSEGYITAFSESGDYFVGYIAGWHGVTQ